MIDRAEDEGAHFAECSGIGVNHCSVPESESKVGSLMALNERVLIVMPARGGSKRIPRKNVVDLCGQPMMHWPLMELSKIATADQVIVSTDDPEIKTLAERKGLTVPFMRPASLADDYAATMPVVQHSLCWYEQNVKAVDHVLVVYPTAVTLQATDVLRAYELLKTDSHCDVVFSATTYSFPIQRAIYKKDSGYMAMFSPEFHAARSQDLVEAFHDAGQFYFFTADAVRAGRELPVANAQIRHIDRDHVIDIDTMEDFRVAVDKVNRLKPPAGLVDWSFK
jgi:pseudaminic acid cytidylyltransferase